MAQYEISHLTRPARYGHGTRQRRRYSARAFWLTLAIFSFLALVAYTSSSTKEANKPIQLDSQHTRLHSRDVGPLVSEEEECRLVHKAHDQCAYIKKHCPDDEPGFLAYLDLYYCQLPKAKPVAFIILVAWLGLLFSTIGIAASDFFCIDLSTIATILGMSESMAGVTFLAFGNGSPDVFSTFAAMSTNSSSLAIGELMGAAGFITAVVAGSMALVRPFRVAKKSFIRDVGFFVVAASFSMVFLADGRLHLWECIAMVVFYIFYVVVVVVWHWVLTRRLKRRERESKARGHFVTPGNEEIAAQEEYHDEDDAAETSSRPTASRGGSVEDFTWLERGSRTNLPRIEEPEEEEEEDEEARERWLGELNTNMRISRPNRGRRNTITPVRPSLVGALEFQSVLTQLNKQRNMQTIPMYTRRYSDDPNYTTAHQQEQISPAAVSDENPLRNTEASEPYGEPQRPTLDQRTASGSRARAVSMNDAAALRADPSFLQKQGQKPSSLIDIAEDDETNAMPLSSSGSPSPQETRKDRSLSPTTHETVRASASNLLAPPTEGMSDGFRSDKPTEHTDYELSPAQSPKPRLRHLKVRIPAASRSPLSRSPLSKSPRNSTPSSPFPDYRDDPFSVRNELPSLYLPAPSVSADGQVYSDDDDVDEEKPIWWWPNRVLPSPWVLISTLFPTLYYFREKSWWERCLAVVAAPSVFLLTITLPVVEAERNEEENDEPELQFDAASTERDQTKAITATQPVQSDGPSRISDDEEQPVTGTSGNGVAGVAAHAELRNSNMPAKDSSLPNQESTNHPRSKTPGPKLWNRWLTIVQLFLAPILIVLIIYTQYLPPDDPADLPRLITKPILIALLTSTVLLIPLLATTTPTYRPRIYETILSLLGFAVSIAWISTIASQVVAVLKTLAVILNMSHAILGLTVFAVGNSLGDLVADITVARLGYPVMALSACFGGPMLNILLGIGLSGSWILIRGAEHRHHKHPDRPVRFRTYDIEVSETLVVSGVGLLVTLIGLLVAVPWNRWMMTRGIAFALIGVWTAFTVTNVVLEVVGVGEKKASG
ncbi:hypothetical protein MBLNU457_1917t1 [Dothideomycetes sp. NU457]